VRGLEVLRAPSDRHVGWKYHANLEAFASLG
jgi:hypothetical protein